MRGADLFDFSDVFETMWGASPSGGEEEMVSLQLRDAGQADGQTGRDVELWAHAPVLYRPAPPSDDGKCQVLTVRAGPSPLAIASRDSRAPAAAGALNPGDAAYCSPTGKVALRCNADGSISLTKQGKEFDSVIKIESDGALFMACPWGQFQFSEEGLLLQVKTAKGEMALGMDGAQFNVTGLQAVLNVASTRLHAAATTPLVSGAVPIPPVFV